MPQDRNTIAPQIIDEASEWFIAMREPDASNEERERFTDWLRASPVHVAAYLETARLWTDAAQIDQALSVDATDALAPNIVALPGAQRLGAQDSAPGTQSSVRRFALAAVLVLAMIAGGTWAYKSRAPAYSTDVGEQRIITLEDGSVVKLNSRSEFKVRLSPRLREIELVSGQALFEVAHDASRPFIVNSGNSAIRAVGTQFDVNRKQSGTVVTVIEGRVRLAPIASPSFTRRSPQPAALDVSAGEQVRVAATGAMERSSNPNTAAAISWLQRELIFEDEPLRDVVEEFNRYTRTPIVLTDDSLADLRINAVFHTTNPDSLLRFISRYDNVRIDRAEKEVRIGRRL